MLAQQKTDVFEDAADYGREAAPKGVRKPVWLSERSPEKPDAAQLSHQLFQIVSNALDGPKGIEAENLVAAFGALAGHCARWMVETEIAAGRIEDDFVKPAGCKRDGIRVSARVDAHVSAMTGKSFAATFVPLMIGSGVNWLPQVNTMILHNFMAINAPTYPDYTVDSKHWPQVPPQALLMMLWEPVLNCLRAIDDAENIAMDAFAMAAADAARVNAKRLPPEVAGQLALETAIAMSKVDYGF